MRSDVVTLETVATKCDGHMKNAHTETNNSEMRNDTAYRTNGTNLYSSSARE
jgi:hypothetical protein